MFKIFKRPPPETTPSVDEITPVPQTQPDVPPVVNPTGEPPQTPAEATPTVESAPSPTVEAPVTPTGLPPVEPPPAEPLPQPAPPRKSILYVLFSPETHVGRVTRPVLRWLAAITGLFALGLLAGYLLLYQPAQLRLDAVLSQLSQAAQQAAQQNKSQQSAVTDRNQAQAAYQQAQASLTKAASENKLLLVLVDISNARVALVNKDGATAKTAIQQAQTDLGAVLPYLQGQDKTQADILQARLDLSAKELVSDPQAALTDLDKLAADLSDLHKKLFP